jgi:hypothetical protein
MVLVQRCRMPKFKELFQPGTPFIKGKYVRAAGKRIGRGLRRGAQAVDRAVDKGLNKVAEVTGTASRISRKIGDVAGKVNKATGGLADDVLGAVPGYGAAKLAYKTADSSIQKIDRLRRIAQAKKAKVKQGAKAFKRIVSS